MKHTDATEEALPVPSPRTRIENKTFDEERALYDSHNLDIVDCRFAGPADGESFLKECSDILLRNCFCDLCYPLWHVQKLTIDGCELTANCRAALWYTDDITIDNTKLHGIKALRECEKVRIENCDIDSPEFGWFSREVHMEDTTVQSEYFMLQAHDLHLHNVDFKGKYSFQYTHDVELSDCRLDTKDALWHAKNVVVRNCEVKGEYLAWYSDGITFIDCHISGTQPLCYCTNLTLINCTMTDCDLSFERSQVEATITTPIDSVKNPYRGFIEAPSIGSVILDDATAIAQGCTIRVRDGE